MVFLISVPVFIGVGAGLFRVLEIVNPTFTGIAIAICVAGPFLNGIIAYGGGSVARKHILSKMYMDNLVEKAERDPNPDLHFIEPNSQEHEMVDEMKEKATSARIKAILEDVNTTKAESRDIMDEDYRGVPTCSHCGNRSNKRGSFFCARCGQPLVQV